jgi:hypothetical protein
MSVKPILFNTEMVRAILGGKKTVTRRAVKYTRDDIYKVSCLNGKWSETYWDQIPEALIEWYVKEIAKAPYQPGGIIYVRETWCKNPNYEEYYFKTRRSGIAPYGLKWRPSIHMPKEVARIWLKVTDVRVERLQDITDEQAIAEGANYKNGKNVGIEEKMKRTAIDRFAEIWDSTVKKSDLDHYGWEANPWAWVIEFERCEKPKGSDQKRD